MARDSNSGARNRPLSTPRILSSYGYDFRVSDRFRIFEGKASEVIDPKSFDDGNYVDFQGEVCVIPPNSYVIANLNFSGNLH